MEIESENWSSPAVKSVSVVFPAWRIIILHLPVGCSARPPVHTQALHSSRPLFPPYVTSTPRLPGGPDVGFTSH